MSKPGRAMRHDIFSKDAPCQMFDDAQASAHSICLLQPVSTINAAAVHALAWSPYNA